MEINHAILDNQLAVNYASLEGFFGGNDGFALRVEDAIKGFTGFGGTIRNRETTLSDQRMRLHDEQEKLDFRMAELEKRSLRQFTAMDSSMAEMQSQLSAMMSILPAG